MRRNLDQSEAAIIQVFEEKQRVWERQMDELRQNYASRLQQVTSLHILIPLNMLRMSLNFIFLYSRCESKCNLCEMLEEVQKEACGQNLIKWSVHTQQIDVGKKTEDVTAGSIPSKLTLYVYVLSAGYPSCSALPDGPAGPDKPSVPGQEEAPGGDGGSAGPERGAGEKVSGLQEGAGRHLASSGGDQVGGEI